MQGVQFVDFSKSNQILPQFSKNAKPFRRVHPGYNYEATCPNKDCGTKGYKVICPMMAEQQELYKIRIQNISFDIIKKAFCPVCKTDLKIQNIKNIYFWKCSWELEGQLNEVPKKNEDEDSDDEDAGLVHNTGIQRATDSCKSFNGKVLHFYQWISLSCTKLPN